MKKTISADVQQELGYAGKVTLNLKLDNQLIAKQTIHNTGRVPLFKFFASCLAADWNTASATFPSRIVLFSAKNGEDDFDPSNWTDTEALTPTSGIMQSTTPEIIANGVSNYCAVRYHFRIPTSLLGGGKATNIGKIGLYSKTATLNDPLAYIFIEDSDKEILSKAENSPNLVIVLDWELTISNQNVVTTTANT